MGMSEFYGATDWDESIATIHRAIELGVTLIDTADVYGSGHNEVLVGRALNDRRDDVQLATKFGIDSSLGQDNRVIRGDPRYVSGCLRSLAAAARHRRHRPVLPAPSTPGRRDRGDGRRDGRAGRPGKVRHLGLSEVDDDQLRRAHAVHPIAAVQSEYSLWTRDPETTVLPALRELGVGLVAFSPARPRLSHRHRRGGRTSTRKDFRSRNPRFAGTPPRRIGDRGRSSAAVAARKGCRRPPRSRWPGCRAAPGRWRAGRADPGHEAAEMDRAECRGADSWNSPTRTAPNSIRSPTRWSARGTDATVLGVAADGAVAGCVDVVQLVLLDRLRGASCLDLAASGQLLQHRDRHGFGVDVEEPPSRAARVGEAEPVGTERGVVRRAPTERSGRARRASSPTPPPPGRPHAANWVVTNGTRRSSSGCSSACCSHSTASRRNSFHDVTDHTSTSTAPVLAEHPLRIQGPRHTDAGREHLSPRPAGAGKRGGVAVHAAQQGLDVEVGRFGRLRHRLVVDRQVVEDVAARTAAPLNEPTPYIRSRPASHDVRDLEGERRVVR